MHDLLRTSSSTALRHLALTLSLLASAGIASAQSAPPARQVAPAPAPAAPAPAAPPQAPPPGGYPAPAPAQQAYPAQPPSTYPGQAPPAQQPYYAPQPQHGYVTPGAYPQQQQQPGVYQQPGAYQQQGSYQSGATYAQPYSSPHGWRPPVRPRRAMMIAGAAILGGSYILGSGIGASILDDDDDWNGNDRCRSCRDVGRWLFVPVVGPFIAMSQTDSGDGALWTLGMVQLAGVGLLTAGIIVYRSSKREIAAQGLGWDLEHGRRLTLDVQSGRGQVGPRMRIDF